MVFTAAGRFARRLEGAFVRYRNCGMTLETGALGQATLRYLHAFGSYRMSDQLTKRKLQNALIGSGISSLCEWELKLSPKAQVF